MNPGAFSFFPISYFIDDRYAAERPEPPQSHSVCSRSDIVPFMVCCWAKGEVFEWRKDTFSLGLLASLSLLSRGELEVHE